MRTSASYSTFGPTSFSTRRRIGEPAIDASPRPSSPPIEVPTQCNSPASRRASSVTMSAT